jgi:hypothetical protein
VSTLCKKIVSFDRFILANTIASNCPDGGVAQWASHQQITRVRIPPGYKVLGEIMATNKVFRRVSKCSNNFLCSTTLRMEDLPKG